MQGVTRYLLRQLTGVLLFITLALTGVVWLSQSLRFVDLIINRGLSLTTFLHLTLLLLPTFLAIILPIALFCAVTYTYHRLTIDSELVVLRASGLSQLALSRPALILAALVTLVCYGLTLYLMPLGFRQFKDRQFNIRTDYSHLVLQQGTFNTLVDGLTVYVRARQSDGEVLGILVHDSRDSSNPVTMMAERGVLVSTPKGPRFVLVNGNRQEMQRDGRKLNLLYFDRYSLDLSNIASADGPRWREPRERFLNELFGPPMTSADKAYRAKLLAEGHQRLVAPLFCLTFALIGLAAVLGGEFDRRGRLWRLMAGAGAAIAFQGLALALSNVVVKFPVLTPLLYANPGLVAVAAAYVLFRASAERRRAPAIRLGSGAA